VNPPQETSTGTVDECSDACQNAESHQVLQRPESWGDEEGGKKAGYSGGLNHVRRCLATTRCGEKDLKGPESKIKGLRENNWRGERS